MICSGPIRLLLPDRADCNIGAELFAKGSWRFDVQQVGCFLYLVASAAEPSSVLAEK